MNQTVAVWLLIIVAIVAANLPFFTRRILGIFPWREDAKPFWLRFGEVLVLYLLVGAFGFLLEGQIGSRHPQNWEFYVTTLSLFLVFAYPGYVWRYMYKK